MRTITPSPLLRTAFLADAAVSGLAAALQVTAPTTLHDALGLPSTLLFRSGIFLVAYTVLLVVLARSARLPVAAVVLVIGGNVCWAVACIALSLMPLLAPSTLGVAYLLMHTSVLVFAALEYAGLRRSEPASSRLHGGRSVGQRAI